MATPRTPLGELHANNAGKRHLNAYQKGFIDGSCRSGENSSSIADAVGCHRSTVWRHSKKLDLPPTTTVEKRGRPKSFDERDIRRVCRLAKQDPMQDIAELRRRLNGQYSSYLIRQMLVAGGLKTGAAATVQELDDDGAKNRLTWARKMKERQQDFDVVMFSDETQIERGKRPQKQQRCIRPIGARNLPKYVATHTAGKDLSVMVWGAIWLGGRSDLVHASGEFAAKKQTCDSKSYVAKLMIQSGYSCTTTLRSIPAR